MYVYEPQKAYVRPRRLMYICVYIYVCLGPRRLMYVCVCMYVCMYVCVYMYVCMYLSPLLQFHHGVFHNIFVAYSIMAYTQIATGLQVALRNNVLNVGVKIVQAVYVSATSMEEQCFG